jgi:glycosyltransferase involved in cell wall biosynthesis
VSALNSSFICSVKVVILHQHFNTPATGGGIRSWYLATALIEKGIEVAVITTHNENTYQRHNVDGIDVHYLPIAYDNKFDFRARSVSFLKYVWQAVALMEKLKEAQLVYAISVPLTVGLAAIRIRKKFNIPFVFEVGDLWPEAPIQLGFINNFFFKHSLYLLEKEIYKKAEVIIALSPAIKEAIALKMKAKKIVVIPNMADCEFFHPEEKNVLLEDRFNVSGKFVVSYIGAIGFANGLDYFLECANASRKNSLPIKFIFCGDGALRERLQGYATKLKLDNLSFISFQNREGVKKIMNITDAAFVCYKRIAVLETGSPNKYFDGLASGKLMIINFGGWIRADIEENKCGFYANPNDPMDFVNQIKTFVEDPDLLKQYQQSARSLAERKYSRERLSKEFADLIASQKH